MRVPASLVLDATVLINFTVIDRLDLLPAVGDCFVSPAAQSEVKRQQEQRALNAALGRDWVWSHPRPVPSPF